MSFHILRLYWASNEGENRTWIEYIEAVMGPTSGAKLWESWSRSHLREECGRKNIQVFWNMEKR